MSIPKKPSFNGHDYNNLDLVDANRLEDESSTDKKQ